jgi:hypothetical protein
MKKSLIIAAVAVGTVVVVGGGAAAYYLTRDTDDSAGNGLNNGMETSDTGGTSDASNEDSGEVVHPELDIVITDYPTYIENDCQYVSFTATLTNNGPVDLEYEDIENGTYSISMSSHTPNGSTILIGRVSDDRVTYTGVEGIAVGESIEVTVVPGQDYENSYTGEMVHDNEMGHYTDVLNGDFEITMEFLEIHADDSFSILSESDPVTVTINVWEDPSDNLLKSCE